MNRFTTMILSAILVALTAQAVPLPVCASIEVDEEEVVFRLDYPDASKVFLTGDFNNWNPKMDSMVKRGGTWELRLYLVPGRYRYMFVVDGENLPDPDNPNRDTDGNTFFIFIEEEGVYSTTYAVTDSGERRIDEKYAPYGALSAVAYGEDYGLFTASAGMKGEIDGNLRGNILVGMEYETGVENPVKAYLLRAKGEWVSEKFSLGVFHRSGRVGFDDPLSLFTDVGPYAYPLDLFCRGAEAWVGWKNSINGRIFFANRIDGYRTSLDGLHDLHTGFPDRWADPRDKDMIGLSLQGGIGPVLVEYMYRHDRGPRENLSWEGEYFIEGRYGIRDSHGLLLEWRKKDYPVLRAQYLTGQTSMNNGSAYSYPDYEPYPVPSSFDMEEGYRTLADISYSSGSFSGLLGWNRTTIDRDPSLLAPGSWTNAVMDVFEARVGYETGRIKIDLGVELEDFSGDGGTGRNFWLQGPNFWLDGDRLRTEMLQFLHSENVWKAQLLLEEKGVEEVPGPFRLEGYFSASMRGDGDTDRSNFEITGGKGIKAGQYLSFHTDLRYVSYSDDRWTGDSGFLDVWLGMRASLAGSGWVAWGVGVAPHRFDRWYYDFTGDGREEYLLGYYLFESVYTNQDWLIDELERAEKALAEEWRMSFEAGFTF